MFSTPLSPKNGMLVSVFTATFYYFQNADKPQQNVLHKAINKELHWIDNRENSNSVTDLQVLSIVINVKTSCGQNLITAFSFSVRPRLLYFPIITLLLRSICFPMLTLRRNALSGLPKYSHYTETLKMKSKNRTLSIQCSRPIIFNEARTHHE